MRRSSGIRTSPTNVFSGPEAIRKFLNPDHHPPTPLVELSDKLNPYRRDGVRIFAKLMNFLPLGNVKSLPAYNMLLECEINGRLKGIDSLVENSSGNTVSSLAILGRIFGISKTKALVSHEVSRGKLQLLRLFGVNVIVNKEPICPDPKDKTSGIYKAKQIGKKKGWFNPGQYDNEANPLAHEKWTGPQIWQQTEGRLSVFCAGLGTTGTMLGAGAYLKGMDPKITTVGVVRFPNNPVPGVRTPTLLQQIAFNWEEATNHIEQVGTENSFERSLDLCRTGILAGPSSGFALQGLLQYIARQKESGLFERLKNSNGEIIAVFICPDSPLPYLDEYFEYLDESHFPKIENENLLINKPRNRTKKSEMMPHASVFEIDPDEAHDAIYSLPANLAWRYLQKNKQVSLRPGVAIVDIRSRGEFSHFHLPGSEQIDLQKIKENMSQFKRNWRGKKIFFLCARGVRSGVITQELRKRRICAWSIRGGAAEWSARGLPRERPKACSRKYPRLKITS